VIPAADKSPGGMDCAMRLDGVAGVVILLGI